MLPVRGSSSLTAFLVVLALLGQGHFPIDATQIKTRGTVVEAGLFSFVRDIIDRLLGRTGTSGSNTKGDSQSTIESYSASSITQAQADGKSKVAVAGQPPVTVDMVKEHPTDPKSAEYGPCKTVSLALPSALQNERFGEKINNLNPPTDPNCPFCKVGEGNTAPLELFIPLKTPKEWACFLEYYGPGDKGVTIADCPVPPAIGCPPGTPTVPLPVSYTDCVGSWCGGAKFRNKNVQTWYRTTANWLCIRQGYSAGACDWDINPNLQGGRYCAYNNEGGYGCDSNNSGINPMIRVHCANPPPPPPPPPPATVPQGVCN